MKKEFDNATRNHEGPVCIQARHRGEKRQESGFSFSVSSSFSFSTSFQVPLITI